MQSRVLAETEIPNAILFERRGERVGYRLTGTLTDEIAMSPPVLNGSLDSLYGDLEEILVGQGLYRDEAHAMLETWKDSWFEEGSRLIYIVLRGFIDNVLGLKIDPAPGRSCVSLSVDLKSSTPATATAVKTAMARNDEGTLNKYGRFFGADSPNHKARTLEEDNYSAEAGDERILRRRRRVTRYQLGNYSRITGYPEVIPR